MTTEMQYSGKAKVFDADGDPAGFVSVATTETEACIDLEMNGPDGWSTMTLDIGEAEQIIAAPAIAVAVLKQRARG